MCFLVSYSSTFSNIKSLILISSCWPQIIWSLLVWVQWQQQKLSSDLLLNQTSRSRMKLPVLQPSVEKLTIDREQERLLWILITATLWHLGDFERCLQTCHKYSQQPNCVCWSDIKTERHRTYGESMSQNRVLWRLTWTWLERSSQERSMPDFVSPTFPEYRLFSHSFSLCRRASSLHFLHILIFNNSFPETPPLPLSAIVPPLTTSTTPSFFIDFCTNCSLHKQSMDRSWQYKMLR